LPPDPRLPAAAAKSNSSTPLWKGVLAGALAGVGFGLTGFFLARIPGPGAPMGSVMFFLVPLAAGVAITMVTAPPRAIGAAALLATIVSLLFLVSLKAEGVLCALMALPLVFVALLAGVAVGLLIRWLSRIVEGSHTAVTSCVLVLLPLAVYAGHRVEMKTLIHPRAEIVTTTIELPATPEQVWANIQSLPAVEGTKPFLMRIGLPIPQRCVLEGTAVGSKRICYFDQGSIEERVLEWDPPRRMRLAIDRTNMPGRHWLEFEGAEYDLAPNAGGTRLTRTTTIESNLYPAWYWRRFERLGVEDEHEYLFSDLSRRFASNSQAPR